MQFWNVVMFIVWSISSVYPFGRTDVSFIIYISHDKLHDELVLESGDSKVGRLSWICGVEP